MEGNCTCKLSTSNPIKGRLSLLTSFHDPPSTTKDLVNNDPYG